MALCHPEYRERMFRAAARYRLAMNDTAAPVFVHESCRAAAMRVACEALRKEELNCLKYDELIEVVIELGRYKHRYDRQEKQIALISRLLDDMFVGKPIV
jgi:hypothetical protein